MPTPPAGAPLPAPTAVTVNGAPCGSLSWPAVPGVTLPVAAGPSSGTLATSFTATGAGSTVKGRLAVALAVLPAASVLVTLAETLPPAAASRSPPTTTEKWPSAPTVVVKVLPPTTTVTVSPGRASPPAVPPIVTGPVASLPPSTSLPAIGSSVTVGTGGVASTTPAAPEVAVPPGPLTLPLAV